MALHGLSILKKNEEAKMIKYLTICILTILNFWFYKGYSQETDHWETIIRVGDSSRYLVPDSDIGTDWRNLSFNDSGWMMGKSGFGYGDNDDNTTLPNGTQCVYMRFEFNVQNLSDIAALYLDMDYDDGFIAYLNGTEVARDNVQDPVSWDMELDGLHEATLYSGVNPERFDISNAVSSNLTPGKNLLAIEVHNQKASSSDMSSNVFLHAGIAIPDTLYGPVPDWFGPPVSFDEFNLPLMIINTNGQEIPDEPRIVADMGIISNGEGTLNKPGDVWNEYSGKISIEIRGESSSGFAKKSYSIELQNADSSNNNVSILGLPEENDFVLYGPYSDKTMIKNVLTYELFRITGGWAPRTRYIELQLNDEYQGVYVLTEKLKRDKNRVDIDKLTEQDTSLTDISGGYILRRDKTNDEPFESYWTSPVAQPYHETMWYQYFDPEYDELTADQGVYIKRWMQEFDEVMSGSGFGNPEIGYRKYIRTKSFIDMMFINEISKGIDNYLFSTYFYKENDTDGGQLVAGPPWDYNLGYGNLNYGEGWDAKETYGWCYPQGSRVYWYERLMEDENYRNQVFCRWTKFRDNIYSNENILAIIDSCIIDLGDAVNRNFAKFPTLGKYVWPAIEPYPTTYEGEIINLKTWLIDRLAWMDAQWLNAGVCSQPPLTIMLTNNTIDSGMPVGTIIGEFSSVDVDSDEHTYALVSGEGDINNSNFSIEGTKLQSNLVFDYQLQSKYSIRVKSEDESSESLEKVFEIDITPNTPNKLMEAIDKSFALYPNPTSGGVNLFNDILVNQDVTIQVVGMAGNVLLDYSGRLQEINTKLMEDTRRLNAGVYIVKVDVSGHIKAMRFVKL